MGAGRCRSIVARQRRSQGASRTVGSVGRGGWRHAGGLGQGTVMQGPAGPPVAVLAAEAPSEPASPAAGQAEDVFDSPTFNVTTYVNRMFPTGRAELAEGVGQVDQSTHEQYGCTLCCTLPLHPCQRLCPSAEDSLADLDPLITTLKQRVRRVEFLATMPEQLGPRWGGAEGHATRCCRRCCTLVALRPDRCMHLGLQIRRVDGEILTAVRQQSTSGSRARQDLGAAKATIGELFGRIREIQRKAEQSELMVQEICRDIKKLDNAKKHLTATITALRRLSMLMNAVGAHVCAGASDWLCACCWHCCCCCWVVVRVLLLLLAPQSALALSVGSCPASHLPGMQTSCSWRWSATSTPRRRSCWRRCSSWPPTSRPTSTSPRWRSSRGG